MKEQYQKEIAQVHVPAELLERTKLAMKEAEKNAASEEAVKPEKGKIFTFPKVSMMAAAAVLLLIVVPVSSELVKGSSQTEQEMQLHLSGPNEIEMQQIVQGEDGVEKKWFEKLVDKIEEFFE